MKNYVVICLVIGAMSSSLVVNSLTIKTLENNDNPCPSNFTGLLPNPEDCQSFYICDAGTPWVTPCPAGLCFNPEGVEGGACDHCELVPGCEDVTGEPSPPPTTITTGSPNTSSETPPSSSTPSQGTTLPGENPCPPGFTGLLPNPEDCFSFFICDAGTAWPTPCPANLCFNPEGAEGGACDHCDLVPGCGSASSRPPTTTESGQTSASTPSNPPTEATPAPTTNTPPQTTASTTTERITTSTQSGGDLSCPPDIPYIYLPYPGNCNKFYFCAYGSVIGEYTCGSNLWFHYLQQVCTAPWGSSCE